MEVKKLTLFIFFAKENNADNEEVVFLFSLRHALAAQECTTSPPRKASL